MKSFKADLHIHTVLSPCGDLDMSPVKIVDQLRLQNINIVAITDHNATHHGPIIRKLAEPFGIKVFFGAEVTSKEEAHLLCLFEDEEQRVAFQNFIDLNLPQVPNKPETFGCQVIVNEAEEILHEIEFLLISALAAGVNQIEHEVHRLGGLFIPAHVDRPRYSLTSQLGFVPSNLNFDALELSRNTSTKVFLDNNRYLKQQRFVRNSDAHYLNDIGKQTTIFNIEEPLLSELKMAFWGVNGRSVEL